ncbi:neo-calmodulin-like [Saccoglossus kowalevskii]|uniref:Calmodulin-like n=1 Tax=Saccoglossus kowalevskii TaxID=10224 RepID=A0ABM0MS30_SACKO|nr:PREDICTED: calmodulin-like [Saccoglossus kowalevskii]
MGCSNSRQDLSKDDLYHAFREFDRNHDGFISIDELRRTMKKLGEKITEDELREMMREADQDGDGRVNYREFVKIIRAEDILDNHTVDNGPADLMEVFQDIDVDGNGYITADELRGALAKVPDTYTETDIEQMMEEADIDGDGQVNYMEFLRVTRKH